MLQMAFDKNKLTRSNLRYGCNGLCVRFLAVVFKVNCGWP